MGLLPVYARNNPSLISWHLDNCSRRLQYHLNSVANVVIGCSGEDDGYIGYKKELLNYKTIKKKLWHCYKLHDHTDPAMNTRQVHNFLTLKAQYVHVRQGWSFEIYQFVLWKSNNYQIYMYNNKRYSRELDCSELLHSLLLFQHHCTAVHIDYDNTIFLNRRVKCNYTVQTYDVGPV